MKTDLVTNELLPEFNRAIAAALAGELDDEYLRSSTTPPAVPPKPLLQTKVDGLSPVLDFLEGKHCLTGVSSMRINFTVLNKDIK